MDRSWGVKAIDASSMQAFAVFMQTALGVAAKWKKLPYRVLVANTRQQAVCPVSVQAACSRLQCLCLYYSGTLQHPTAAPYLRHQPSFGRFRGFRFIHFHLQHPSASASASSYPLSRLSLHCTPNSKWFIRCCASMCGSENQHQFISVLLVSDAPYR